MVMLPQLSWILWTLIFFDNPFHKVIGIGTHRVDIQFNRAMNVETRPFRYVRSKAALYAKYHSGFVILVVRFNDLDRILQCYAADKFRWDTIKFQFETQLTMKGFEIPIEDYRFEFQLNVAGVLSTGFFGILVTQV